MNFNGNPMDFIRNSEDFNANLLFSIKFNRNPMDFIRKSKEFNAKFVIFN